MSKAIMQQALEALEMMRDKYSEYACPACDHADTAITALRQDLAKPEQEPVAWISESENLLSWDKFYDHMKPLYTAPTPRKPLTDEELEPLLDAVPFYDIGNKDLINLARAIERAHGIGEQHE